MAMRYIFLTPAGRRAALRGIIAPNPLTER
jgi:hypothetical protein